MFKKGTRVRYISDDADGRFYPPKNTLGTCMGGTDIDISGKILVCVKWDTGTKGDGTWYCYDTDIEIVEEQ